MVNKLILFFILVTCVAFASSSFATKPTMPSPSALSNSNTSNTSNTSNNSNSENADLASTNLAESNAFLEANKKKAGVVTLPSGLQYKILQEGTGKTPSPTGYVTVNYQGTLPNGTVFDSSYATKEPVTFGVNAVIPGWQEVLPLMKTGSKWMVFVPPQLAYGQRGVGQLIGPNQALIFEIELVDTNDTLDDEFKKEHDEEWEDPSNMATP